MNFLEESKIKNDSQKDGRKLKYNPKFIFIEKNKEELQKRIEDRLLKRMNLKKILINENNKETINYIFLDKKRNYKNDLIKEVEYLRDKLKINDEFLLSLGLEYRYITLYLQEKLSLQNLIETLKTKI